MSDAAMERIRGKSAFICDMDGVLYHGNRLLPGAKEFVAWLQRERKHYLFLTNSSQRSPRELREKLARLGIAVPEDVFYTSALATAAFLASQKPGGSAYVIGEAGLITALHAAGFSMNSANPDYVVIGETPDYNYGKMVVAVNLVLKGARLIGTNPDMTGPGEDHLQPACKALVAPVELTTGHTAYFVGKPNPLIMRHALKQLGCRREDTVIIGDRMDTDIVAGIESEIDTVLVLSGVTTAQDLARFPYQPGCVLAGVGDIASP